MGLLVTILLIIGFVGLAKGIFIYTFPSLSLKVMKFAFRNKIGVKRFGFFVLLASVGIILIAINI